MLRKSFDSTILAKQLAIIAYAGIISEIVCDDPIFTVTDMTTNILSIPYPETLLLSLKKSPEAFEAEARLLLAIKFYEMGQITTGTAANLAGIGRVAFMFELARFGLSPIGQTPDDVAEDFANA